MKLRKLAVVGPESTGKSALSAALADHMQTQWVPEFARTYLDGLGRPYEQADLYEIALGQLAWENRYAQLATDWLVCDTHLLVIKIWSEFKYGQTDPRLLQLMDLNSYSFHLLTDIDLPWEEDPQREHPFARQELFRLYYDQLEAAGVPFGVVRGQGETRLRCARQLLREHGLV